MRDKFIFEKNDEITSPEHKNRQRDIARIFDANKGSRKLLEQVARARMGSELQALQDPKRSSPATEAETHDVLNAYERTHLDIGSWPRIRGSLKMRWRNLRIEEKDGVATLHEKIGSSDGELGWIYLDHMRFVELDPQPAGAKNAVYLRTNDALKRHYIMLPAEKPRPPIFVRRFVIRGLNGHNAMELDAGQPMKAAYTARPTRIAMPQPQEVRFPVIGGNPGKEAPRKHPVDQSTALTEPQQLLSHTRGWKKRSISAGVSNKPPLSTRGTVFNSLFGNVAIDLAMVPANQIFDLHSPTAAQRNLGLDPKLVVSSKGHGYPANDYAGEEFLALRDVLRTRELVIKNDVAIAAIHKVAQGKKILAIGFSSKDDRMNELTTALDTRGATLPIPQPEKKEPEDFTWSDGRRWFFALYTSEAACTTAATDARGAYSDITAYIKQINQYDFLPPAGMVLT